MEPSPGQRQPTAEALFAEFLDQLEAGASVDFDAWCRQYPDLEPALRKVHVRWQAMSEAFTHLSRDAAATTTATSKSVDDLKAKIGSPGGRLARYALREEIARGAMGRIVSAWDEELRREVALKIHRGAIDDARMQRRFLEEAQIAAQLDHPGIVSVHELGVDGDGRPFFAMQLVRGRDLGQVLAAVKNGDDGWSRTRVLSVLLRVCEAMAFAHDKGVVHRDLKPGNVMVGRFGETYVMDWGLAHVQGQATESESPEVVATLRQTIADEDGDSALLTHAGDVIGTPAYMAPEQAAGEKSVSPAVDIYSLGAILWHLLAGAMPYAAHARSADAVLAAVRAGPPVPLPDDVPPELHAICERAMAREPSARYATMLELGDDLRAFLEVRTVRAYATGRFAELRKWVARNKALATTAAAFTLATIVGAIAMAALWVRADDHRQLATASAAQLQIELDRSAFRSARQALQLDNSTEAANALWHAHFAGRMPRATNWALTELAVRDPYVAVAPEREDRSIAFTIRGDSVLVGGADGRLQLRAVPTLAVTAEIGERGPKLSAVAALDESLAVAGTADGQLVWFDLAQQRIVRRVQGHNGVVTRLAAHGRAFASAGADGKVAWWPDPDAEPRTLLTYKTRIQGLALRPDGSGVMAGDNNGWIEGVAFDDSWHVKRRHVADSITSLAFGTNADRLWLGDGSHQLHRLDLADDQQRWVRWSRNGACRQLIEMRDGSLLIGGWWRTDRMTTDAGTFTPVALRPVTRMVMSRDERWLVTTNPLSGLGVVDLAPTDRRTFADVGATGLSGDGRLLATSAGNHATLYDLATGKVARELAPGSGGWMALDRDGSHLAVTKTQPGTVAVYDVASGTLLHSSPGPTSGSGFFTRFHPDSSELAFAIGADRLRRVRTVSGETIAEYQLPGRGLALAYSGDGKHLAALARSRSTVRVFDLADGSFRDEEFANEWPATITPTMTAVALSHDGALLAVGNNSGPIRVRRANGTTLALPGHAGTVWSLQWSPHDPGLLFSTGGSQGIAAWDLDSGCCCYQTVHDQASQMELSADGSTLSCTTPAGAIAIDLTYRERHVAGNLPVMLDSLRDEVGVAPARERELRDWAAAVLARPWPRWQ